MAKTAKKPFQPQSLRTLLGFLLVVIILGGGALFYFGLDIVRSYAVQVNERLADADASEKLVQQLKVLEGQIAQSELLIAKADKTFTSVDTYQPQALIDIGRYAAQTGISVAGTSFEAPVGGKHIVVVKLSSPTSYSKLVQFLTLLEGNLPKMQVTSLQLKHTPGSNADSVEVGEIKINILVR